MKNFKLNMKGMRYLSMAALCSMPLYFASCSNSDDPVNGDDALTEIRLASSISGEGSRNWASRGDDEATTTASVYSQNQQVAPGEQVTVVVYDKGTSTTFHASQTLTADGNGNLSGATLYYPASGHNVDIYTVHGSFTATSGDAALISSIQSKSGAAFTVKTDQTANADYLASDLLYASNSDVKRSKDKVTLSLTHRLARVQVSLKDGNALNASEITAVKVSGVYSAGTFTTSGTAPKVTASGSTTTISLGKGEDGVWQAVVVPQTSIADVKLHLITSDGGELSASLATTANTKFDDTYSYKYNVTPNLTDIDITTVITDWSDGGEQDITAEMQ